MNADNGPDRTARMERERTVATDVYWLMTGPRVFSDSVARAIGKHRWLAIHTPTFTMPGFATALERALERAHLDNEEARWVKVNEQQEVATLIGTLYQVATFQPLQLAQAQSTIRTIVLQPTSETAMNQCKQYLQAFAESTAQLQRARGQLSLVAILPETLDAAREPIASTSQEMLFSGALTPHEMQAYVAVRMGDRSGPGQTDLFRMLVTEFAGYDAQLAEELIGFSDEALLELPRSLQWSSSQGDSRWRTGRWSAGCYADIGGKRQRHVLYELYLSQHAGPDQRDASEWLKRRYWRACLRSLLPWLEERRARVIDVLRAPLEHHLKRTGGKAIRPTLSGAPVETEIDDLEYNQISGMVLNDGFKVSGTRLTLAVNVCFAAKRVRDSMAHMRAPEAGKILELNDLMERLLP